MQAQLLAETSLRSTTQPEPGGDDDTLLTSRQVRTRVGEVTDMCLWRWMRDARVMFPQPLKINKRNYWRLGDLRRWQAERVNNRAA